METGRDTADAAKYPLRLPAHSMLLMLTISRVPLNAGFHAATANLSTVSLSYPPPGDGARGFSDANNGASSAMALVSAAFMFNTAWRK